MVAVGKQTALDQPGLLSALPYGGSVSGTPPYLPPSTRDQEQLLAAAPRSIARDLTLLLTILTTKAQSGALSPAGFVTALRYLRDFEKKPFENFSALTSTLRGVPLIGPLILKDPRSPEARGLASAAAFSALSGCEKGALASQAIVDAGMRLLTFFKDHGLLEAPRLSRKGPLHPPAPHEQSPQRLRSALRLRPQNKQTAGSWWAAGESKIKSSANTPPDAPCGLPLRSWTSVIIGLGHKVSSTV